MSQEQIEVVERFYAALDARDLDALAKTVAIDAVWDTPVAIPFGGRLVGRDAVRGFVTDAWGFFDDYHNVRERIVASGDRVVVSGAHGGRVNDGSEHSVPYQTIFTVADGEIVACAMQIDAGLVVRAVAAEFGEPPPPAAAAE